MPITHPNLHLSKLPGAIPAWSGEITPDDLQPICQNMQDGGGRLVALWGSDERGEGKGYALHIALVNEKGLICLSVPLPAQSPNYPTSAKYFLRLIVCSARRMTCWVFTPTKGMTTANGCATVRGMAAAFRCARISMRLKAAPLSSILWVKQLAIRLGCKQLQLSRWLSRKR